MSFGNPLGNPLGNPFGVISAANGGVSKAKPLAVGDKFQGGFYIGLWYVGIKAFALVLADKSADSSQVWGSASLSLTSDDSDTNTKNMVTAGCPAAIYCANYLEGGWALPSQTTTKYIYDTVGPNNPLGITDWLAGGPQAFQSQNYWISGEYDSVNAIAFIPFSSPWRIAIIGKTSSRLVRPVKLVPLSPYFEESKKGVIYTW